MCFRPGQSPNSESRQMRGGKRPGAGRRRGIPNMETVRKAEAVAAAGITPKQYLLNGLNHYQGIITAERAKGAKADQTTIAAAYAAGKEFAKDVAPYVHPRLARWNSPARTAVLLR